MPEYDDVAYDDFEPVIGSEADGGYNLLKPGVYPFKIEQPVEKKKCNGKEKIPPCNQVVVKLKVDGGVQGTSTIPYNLYITMNRSWLIKQLFVGVGLVNQDEAEFKPKWNNLIGSSGAVEIGTHIYNNREYNDVKKILNSREASDIIAENMQKQPTGFPGA